MVFGLTNFRAEGMDQVLAHGATYLGLICFMVTSSHPGIEFRQWEPGLAQS